MAIRVSEILILLSRFTSSLSRKSMQGTANPFWFEVPCGASADKFRALTPDTVIDQSDKILVKETCRKTHASIAVLGHHVRQVGNRHHARSPHSSRGAETRSKITVVKPVQLCPRRAQEISPGLVPGSIKNGRLVFGTVYQRCEAANKVVVYNLERFSHFARDIREGGVAKRLCRWPRRVRKGNKVAQITTFHRWAKHCAGVDGALQLNNLVGGDSSFPEAHCCQALHEESRERIVGGHPASSARRSFFPDPRAVRLRSASNTTTLALGESVPLPPRTGWRACACSRGWQAPRQVAKEAQFHPRFYYRPPPSLRRGPRPVPPRQTFSG